MATQELVLEHNWSRHPAPGASDISAQNAPHRGVFGKMSMCHYRL